MASPTLLHIPRHDSGQGEPDFIIVHIATAGQNQLDLKLIGTEGTEAYSVTLKHNHTSELKAKNNSVTKDQWDKVLVQLLLGIRDAADDVAEGLEAVSRVKDESIIITIQRRIEGITQRLGEICMPESEDEFEWFPWMGLAVKREHTLKHEFQTLQSTIRDKDIQIKKLKDSLAELVRLKQEDEAQRLEKFSILLNEKKLKIRDQQRILAGAVIDPAKVEAVEESRIAIRSRSSGASRKGKRKATEAAEDSDEGADDDFEQMGVEKMQVDEEVANDSSAEDIRTPEQSEEETQSEDDDEPVPTKKITRITRSKDGKTVLPSNKKTENIDTTKIDIPTTDIDQDNFEVPAKRVLPFAKKPAQPARPTPADDGSETQSDDDEL